MGFKLNQFEAAEAAGTQRKVPNSYFEKFKSFYVVAEGWFMYFRRNT